MTGWNVLRVVSSAMDRTACGQFEAHDGRTVRTLRSTGGHRPVPVPALLGGLLLVVTFGACEQPGLFDQIAARYAEFSWAYEVEVEVDGSMLGSTLTDVPVLFSLTPERIDYEAIRLDGRDLEFRDALTDRVLAYELERWTPGGASAVWVLLPELGPAGATVKVTYGRWVEGDGYDPAGVWRNGYAGVWHFSDTGPSYADSTGNGNTATTGGAGLTAPAEVAGIAGGALDFSVASDAGLRVDPRASLADLAPVSVTFAHAACPECNNDFLFHKARVFMTAKDGDTRFYHDYVQLDEFGEPILDQNGQPEYVQLLRQFAYDLDAPGWTVGGLVWGGDPDTNDVVAYRNGSANGGFNGGSPIGTPADHAADALVVGNGSWTGSYSRAFRGSLDEFRLSAVERSPDWMAFQAGSLRDLVVMWGSATSRQLRDVPDIAR